MRVGTKDSFAYYQKGKSNHFPYRFQSDSCHKETRLIKLPSIIIMRKIFLLQGIGRDTLEGTTIHFMLQAWGLFGEFSTHGPGNDRLTYWMLENYWVHLTRTNIFSLMRLVPIRKTLMDAVYNISVYLLQRDYLIMCHSHYYTRSVRFGTININPFKLMFATQYHFSYPGSSINLY